jgi:hypothetical protein
MKRVGRVGIFVVALVFVVGPLLVETKPQATAKPSFEVTSIKPSPPNLNIRGGGPLGDRFAVTGGSLKML